MRCEPGGVNHRSVRTVRLLGTAGSVTSLVGALWVLWAFWSDVGDCKSPILLPADSLDHSVKAA